MTSFTGLLCKYGGDRQDLDSAHRVLRRWAQARLGQGDDFWNDDSMDGVAKAAIDVIAVCYGMLRQLDMVAGINDTALARIEAFEIAAEKAEIGEEHF